jgi:hypothetical protein
MFDTLAQAQLYPLNQLGSHGDGPKKVSEVRRSMQLTVGSVCVIKAITLALLWPAQTSSSTDVGPLTTGKVVPGEPCVDTSPDCARLTVRVTQGQNESKRSKRTQLWHDAFRVFRSWLG